MTELKRDIYFTAAYDKRHPDPGKNYGIHGAEMRFVLSGDEGAVQFLLYTNWYLPHVTRELESKRDGKYNYFLPMPADIGYHSPKPIYEGQEVMAETCEYLGGKPCYYDGSGLQAEVYFEVLVSEGGEALWKKMEHYYHELFDETTDTVPF